MDDAFPNGIVTGLDGAARRPETQRRGLADKAWTLCDLGVSANSAQKSGLSQRSGHAHLVQGFIAPLSQ
jgi:hypothetical protein